MEILGLGKITVATAGTPVAVSSTSLKVRSVVFSFDPVDAAATITVKDKNNAVVGAITKDSGPLEFCAGGGNPLDLSTLTVDSSANGGGPYVGYILG